MAALGDFHTSAFVGLAVLASLLHFNPWKQKASTSSREATGFQSFQRNYLAVFLVMCAADWLQGPYVYALYEEYGFTKGEIGILFVMGFGVSGIGGAFVGPLADTWGRKKVCLLYSLFYALGCMTKHFPNFAILALGRFFCGAATSILFSVFDAWMVHEHHERQYNSEWVGETFGAAAFFNGLTAIFSAVLASFAAERYGKVAPFDLAIGFLVVGGIMVYSTWNENYGSSPTSPTEGKFNTAKDAVKQCIERPVLALCGCVQSLFEGAMYTFVLMWTPTLPQGINHGLVFGCFMVAVMIGSQIFHLLRSSLSWKLEYITMLSFFISIWTMMVPIVTHHGKVIFGSFVAYEIAVGIYLSAFYTLRSEIVPDKGRATILNLYRMPLNLIVVLICLNASRMDSGMVFGLCALFEVLGLLCAFLIYVGRSPVEPLKDIVAAAKLDSPEQAIEMGGLQSKPTK